MIETYDVGRQKWHWWAWGGGAALLVILVLFSWWLTRPPVDFPAGTAVTIPRGLSASSIADLMKDNDIVRSSGLLYSYFILYHDPSTIQAGTYYFEQPLSVFKVADRITKTAATDNLVALTLPEGYTIREYAYLSTLVLPDFDDDDFIRSAKGKEGYLFPDTYYLPADFTALELIELLEETYVQKTESIQERIRTHELGEEGVLILASIIEREANTAESMKMVSGVLQNRLEEGMALQADASIEYVLGRPLNQLEAEDLEMDSPYNTYLYRGLPPTPIGNPGLTSIMAVLEPTSSNYFYYLTDEDGVFHYARTFDEHKRNIERYLR